MSHAIYFTDGNMEYVSSFTTYWRETQGTRYFNLEMTAAIIALEHFAFEV